MEDGAQELSSDEFRRMVDEAVLPKLHDFYTYVAAAGRGPDVVVGRAWGVLLWDLYGKQYLDMTGGGGPLVLGHCHDAATAGPHAQLPMFSTSAPAGAHVWFRQVELAKALSERFPPDRDGMPKQVLFANSGREALLMAAAIGGREINPLPAAGDFDPGWAAQEAARARKAGFPVVVDETRTGFGRMGSFTAQERLGVEADVTVLGETGGGGLPFGAVVADSALLSKLSPPPFAAGPVVSIAALGVLEQMTQDMFDYADSLGESLRAGLQEVADQFPDAFAGLRGWGTLRQLVLAKPRARRFRDDCLNRGLLVDAPADDVVAFSPALVATEADVDEAMNVVAEVCMDGGFL